MDGQLRALDSRQHQDKSLASVPNCVSLFQNLVNGLRGFPFQVVKWARTERGQVGLLGDLEGHERVGRYLEKMRRGGRRGVRLELGFEVQNGRG